MVKKLGQSLRLALGALLSIGLVGTFALPAQAHSASPDTLPDGFLAAAQQLDATETEVLPAVLQQVEGELSAAEVARQEEQAQRRAAAEAQQAQLAAPAGPDIPAGEGGAGIAAAALAQLGVAQDCTALVEQSLRAIGIPAGDLGTQVHEYTALGGAVVASGDYAPGDVLVFPGQHVAVYIGDGQAVHGGWGGTTRLGPLAPGGETGLTVVRF
ncbi:NlpC/P60 family protein [Leucobacter sp. HY1910]